jgi:hypothetical protein
MVKLRKILFWIFVAVYLALCPNLILHSLGIVIKPGNQKVVKTGIIHISSIPAGASIILNGKPLNEETPTAINNLMPGTYTVELVARKYHPLEKTVRVAAAQVTPLDNLLLIPDPLNVKELSSQPFETLIPVTGNPYLLVAKGQALADMSVYLWDEGLTQNLIPANEDKAKASKLHPVIPADSPYGTAKLVKLHTTRNSPYILFEIEADSEKKLLWIDPLFGTPKIEDITDLFPEVPTEIQWDANNARHILSFQHNTINRLDLATKAIYPKILDHVVEFSQFGQDIIVLTEDREVKRSSQTGTNQRLVSNDPWFNEQVFLHFPFRSITSVSDNLSLLLGKHGELIGTLKPYLLADSGIEGFKWNDKPPRLLVWSRYALGFIEFPRRFDSPDPEVPATVRWLTQNNKDITDAFWVNDGSHILFVDDNRIFLADTGTCDLPDIGEIAEIKKDSNIYYSDKAGRVFFLTKEGLLSSIEIVPQRTLLKAMKFEKSKDEDK